MKKQIILCMGMIFGQQVMVQAAEWLRVEELTVAGGLKKTVRKSIFVTTESGIEGCPAVLGRIRIENEGKDLSFRCYHGQKKPFFVRLKKGILQDIAMGKDGRITCRGISEEGPLHIQFNKSAVGDFDDWFCYVNGSFVDADTLFDGFREKLTQKETFV